MANSMRLIVVSVALVGLVGLVVARASQVSDSQVSCESELYTSLEGYGIQPEEVATILLAQPDKTRTKFAKLTIAEILLAMHIGESKCNLKDLERTFKLYNGVDATGVPHGVKIFVLHYTREQYELCSSKGKSGEILNAASEIVRQDYAKIYSYLNGNLPNSDKTRLQAGVWRETEPEDVRFKALCDRIERYSLNFRKFIEYSPNLSSEVAGSYAICDWLMLTINCRDYITRDEIASFRRQEEEAVERSRARLSSL